MKLEELERRLRNDVVHEALAWGGCAARNACSGMLIIAL